MIIKYIEEKTEKLLQELNVSYAPVDVYQCAKYLGVDVQPVSLKEDISGLFVIKDKMAYIRYNENEKNKQRQRFTIAHELGHFVLHKNIPLFIDKGEKLMYRDTASTTGELQKEREANAFAASLLMPKFLIEKKILNIPQNKNIVDYLAEKFNVSDQAMNFRLSNLGMLDFGLF